MIVAFGGVTVGILVVGVVLVDRVGVVVHVGGGDVVVVDVVRITGGLLVFSVS